MKILLLEHPRSINTERCNDIANTPLSSCLLTGYAAALLKKSGHQVTIIEGHMDGLAYSDIIAAAMAIRPDIIGVHMVYHWKRDAELFYFLEQIKAEFAPYMTAYGFYPTIAFEDILNDSGAIDSVILGEPEQTFKELADAVTCKAHNAHIEGTAVRVKSGGIMGRHRAVLKDINALPFPV